MTKKFNPKVSIILRSFNEERWIGACLEAIQKQTYKNFEVILVDNNSTDKTVERAKLYPIKIINIVNFMPGLSLNMGIRESSGEYLVCLSAHCIPVNDHWLENLVKPFENDPKLAGVYGRQEPMSFTPDTDKRDLLTIFGLDKKIQYKDSFFHNANSIIRRDLWVKVPFDEKITNIEDRLWAREILQLGYHLIYEPEASVFHHHGIHQNQNQERLMNVVRIIENLNRQDGINAHITDLKQVNALALIPVKGESLVLGGKSLLELTINSAKQSKAIKKIIVSTDNEKTAKLARELGAEVPFLRDASLSEDYVDLEQVYRYSLEMLESKGMYFDVIVPLEVTFPFREKNLIDEIVYRLVHEGLDTVISVKQEFAASWVKKEKDYEKIDQGFTPRKYKDPLLVSVKGLAVATRPSFLRQGQILGNKVGMYQITNLYSLVEVRDSITLNFAENLAKNLDLN